MRWQYSFLQQTLTEFNIDCNKIENEGARHLSQVFKQNTVT